MTPEEMSVRLIETETRSKSNQRRLDEVEGQQKALAELATAVKVFASEFERLQQDVSIIGADVKDLKEKPAKRWDGIVDKILLTIIGAIVGLALAKVGL